MFFSLLKDSSYPVKFLFSGFIILLCFTMVMVFGLFFSYLFFDTDIKQLSENLSTSKPENIPLMKFMQSCFTVGLFVIPPFFIAYLIHGNISEFLSLKSFPEAYTVILSFMVIVFSIPLVNYLAFLNEKIHFPSFMNGIEAVFKQYETEAKQTTDAFLHVKSIKDLLINLLVIALIPALGEELMFRGIFQRLFYDWSRNIHFSVFISSLIFSALHLQFYGTLPRLLLGMLFGYIFYWTKNLWLPILSHFLNNAIAIVMIYLNNDVSKPISETSTEQESMKLVLFSIISLGLLLLLLYKAGKEKKLKLTQSYHEKQDT